MAAPSDQAIQRKSVPLPSNLLNVWSHAAYKSSAISAIEKCMGKITERMAILGGRPSTRERTGSKISVRLGYGITGYRNHPRDYFETMWCMQDRRLEMVSQMAQLLDSAKEGDDAYHLAQSEDGSSKRWTRADLRLRWLQLNGLRFFLLRLQTTLQEILETLKEPTPVRLLTFREQHWSINGLFWPNLGFLQVVFVLETLAVHVKPRPELQQGTVELYQGVVWAQTALESLSVSEVTKNDARSLLPMSVPQHEQLLKTYKRQYDTLVKESSTPLDKPVVTSSEGRYAGA